MDTVYDMKEGARTELLEWMQVFYVRQRSHLKLNVSVTLPGSNSMISRSVERFPSSTEAEDFHSFHEFLRKG